MVQSSLQRTLVLASLAGFFSWIVLGWVERPAVELLEERWARLLAYSILPTAVCFIILYRSCWHPEIVGIARTCCVLCFSCVILVGALVAAGVLVCVAWFCLNAVSGGFHP